ncbi:MAG: LysR family transcriptional regulator [Coriobacteriia bacterium]|nr:LysR family transcriptional regulator [Coriobacteriia bacterium]MBN2822214.1 LysR family transcriptional regulator [Coriobacteriia bacterium]
MNITQLEYFLAIAQTRKFSTAAEHVYVSQSCLSKQIKALEEELGVELFYRTSSGTSLTAAGETFLDFSRNTLRSHERVLARLAKYTAGAAIRVRIGALPLMSVYDLHAALADYQVDNMGVQIDFYERNQGEIISRLKMDRLDAAILRTDLLSEDEYDWFPIVTDEIVVICSTDHPLARRKRVTPIDLKDERFVVLDEQSAITSRFMSLCRESGFVPNITYTHQRHEPLVAAVSRGLGISILPKKLTQSRNPSGLSCVQFQDPIYTDVSLVVVHGKELGPYTEKLIDHFRKRYPVPSGASPDPTPADRG